MSKGILYKTLTLMCCVKSAYQFPSTCKWYQASGADRIFRSVRHSPQNTVSQMVYKHAVSTVVQAARFVCHAGNRAAA